MPNTSPTRPNLLMPLPLALLLVVALTTLARAQPGGSGLDFEAEPTRIDALGLSVMLPLGSQAEITSIGANTTMGVELPDGMGVMVIKGQRSTNPDLTVEQVVDSIVEQLMRTNSGRTVDGRLPDQAVGVLERTRDLAAGGLSGERVYLDLPSFRGEPALVRGFTVFRVEPRQFIIFDLMVEAADFPRARRAYETTVGTVDISTLDQQARRRAAAIANAQRVIQTLDPSTLRELAERYPERWERLYTPAASGDDADATEHGYRRIRVSLGVKGEVTGKPERNWRPGDRAPGLIVKLDAMALESNLRVDTRAVYFVSEDGNEEAWTVKMALRQGTISTESSVTGARSGTSMTVQLQQDSEPPQITKPLIQGEGYLSQALAQVMVPALVQNAQTGTYAFYAYNPSSNTITLRTDEVSQPQSSPGLWVVSSRPDTNTPAVRHFYNARGDLLRTELHNRRIWEPIELDRLVRIWQRKGLPLE